MRTELTSTDGYWWKRISDNSIHKNLILGDWDSSENYIQIPDSEVPDTSEDLTDTEALDIILDR